MDKANRAYYTAVPATVGTHDSILLQESNVFTVFIVSFVYCYHVL